MLYKIFNVDSLTITSSILSFTNATLCVYLMHKYGSTKDTKWITNASKVFFTFIFVDLLLTLFIFTLDNTNQKKHCETILHHILSFFICLYGDKIGIHAVPEAIQKIILMETSTIFLNIRFWIKTHLNSINKLKQEKTPFANLIEKINPFNEAMLGFTFVYYRIFIFLKDILIYKEFYPKFFENTNYYFINKAMLVLLFIFFVLNAYWTSLILKSLQKIIKKSMNTSNDADLLLIEKIQLQILSNRE